MSPSHKTTARRPPSRRGVLLLVVLSMLTLFMMLGVAFLLAATRAKDSARAFARLTFTTDDARVPYASQLDRVLMTVLRDTANFSDRPKPLGGTDPFKFESLLSDRYGRALIDGSVTDVSISGAIIRATFATTAGTMPTNKAALNGRVLTFLPVGGRVTSHRIIRADGANLYLAPSLMPDTFAKPTDGTRAIINGAEFSADPEAANPLTDNPTEHEAWDGFDNYNLFIARVEPSGVSGSTVQRPSYLGSMPVSSDLDADGIPDRIDNDGDGSEDGVFLNFDLPSTVSSAAETINTHASVLVLDLDGRFNVNAHGSLSPIVYPTSHTQWTSEVSGLSDVPLGSGYGPAEIQANLATGLSPNVDAGSRLLDSTSMQSGELPNVNLMSGADTAQQTGKRETSGSRFTAGTPSSSLPAIEGKYGERARVGSTTVTNDTQLTDNRTVPGRFGLARPGKAKDTETDPTTTDPGTTDTLVSRETEHDRRIPPGIPPDDAAVKNFGVPPTWWTPQTSFNWATRVPGGPLPRSIFNSPPDLHGRMKTLTLPAAANETVPHLTFSKPEWMRNLNGGRFAELTDDPYDIRLDAFVSRGGRLHDPATNGTTDPQYDLSLAVESRDNPFTVAELESVLRPYDIDTKITSPRLAAILGSAAEDLRLKVTTDSWDTTAIVGGSATTGECEAAKRLDAFLNDASTSAYGSTAMGGHTRPISGKIAHEVSRRERFDLNRPLPGAEDKPAAYDKQSSYYVQRQAYCKDLYTLLCALDPTANKAELAQWAVNACDFRDADSIMTPFEYDTNPLNGWDVDGDPTKDTYPDPADPMSSIPEGDRAFVWGSERPEMVISETYAWESESSGGLYVMLHRPWKATAYADGTTSIDGEPIDPLFEEDPANPTNKLDLTRTVSVAGSSEKYPVWRLRVVGYDTSNNVTGTRYVRFDTNGTMDGNEFRPKTATPPSDLMHGPKFQRAAGSWLLLRPATTLNEATGSSTIDSITLDSQVFKAPGNPAAVSTATDDPSTWPLPRQCRVYLERLTDPSAEVTSTDQGNVWPGAPKSPTIPSGLPRYVVVDEAPVQVVNRSTPPPLGLPLNDYDNAKLIKLSRSTSDTTIPANKANAFWAADNIDDTAFDYLAPVRFTKSASQSVGPLPSGSSRWFHWPNRPFTSAVELLLVPRGDRMGMLHRYESPTSANQGSIGAPIAVSLLFDAVHVPTRFIGVHNTYPGANEANTGINNDITTINQISSFREPGRVNINTITSNDVWNSVVGGPLSQGVLGPAGTNKKTRTAVDFATTPARTLANALALQSGNTPTPVMDTYADDSQTLQQALARNPVHAFYTANRLANTVTIRSNLFAVWITLRTSVANDPDSVKYHRAFAIIDRSIPVGFEPGKDHNVRDTIRLWRVIE